MAVSMDFKYFCKICKKGFGCGRALGGHMRAHGIAGDDGGNGDDEDNAGDWEEKNELSSPAATPAADRRMYTLRANPNRLRSCRVCENCGEEFSSWKSFLEHGRCRYDEEGDGGDGDDEDDDVDDMILSPAEEVEMGRWSKGKRSRRQFRSSSSNAAAGGNYSGEDVDLANWLVMLSAARVDPDPAESEESCASASKEDGAGAGSSAAVPRGMFECKGCKKVFSSHQALGGHRASHKKVKGCFAARQVEDVFPGTVDAYPTPSGHGAGASASLQITLQQHMTPPASGKKKSKVHECSICHRVFSSGQALGGHKRCHWVTSNAASSEPASMANLHLHPPLTTTLPPKLDLNMPAPVDELPLFRPREHDDPFRLEVSASLYLQPWMGSHTSSSINFNSDGSKMNKETTVDTVGSPLGHLDQYSDADSKVKLAKLSELKDINSGGSSPWLQVGIGTSSTVVHEK